MEHVFNNDAEVDTGHWVDDRSAEEKEEDELQAKERTAYEFYLRSGMRS